MRYGEFEVSDKANELAKKLTEREARNAMKAYFLWHKGLKLPYWLEEEKEGVKELVDQLIKDNECLKEKGEKEYGNQGC